LRVAARLEIEDAADHRRVRGARRAARSPDVAQSQY
jgi:hypothetical protein